MTVMLVMAALAVQAGAARAKVDGPVKAGPAAMARGVQYRPLPDWVVPPPAPTATSSPGGLPLRIVYSDQQIRIGKAADETFTAFRVKILAPEVPSVGNVGLTWNPASEQATVHLPAHHPRSSRTRWRGATTRTGGCWC